MIDDNSKCKKRKNPGNKEEQITLANEVKVAILTFQGTEPNVSPFFPMSGRPQTTNAPSSMTEECCEICLEASRILLETYGIHSYLLNTCNDAVASDIQFTKTTLLEYMAGSRIYVATIDIKHVMKALRFHCLTSCNKIICVGKHFIDIGLLDEAQVPSELICFTDWASDVIVLRLISYNTVHLLLNIPDTKLEEVGAITMTITFLRMHLFAMTYNGKPLALIFTLFIFEISS